jgi:hypothetical protein
LEGRKYTSKCKKRLLTKCGTMGVVSLKAILHEKPFHHHKKL